ncbi:MAG: ORF6N domain-containing protein, partial [Bacteroidales bacterium]|nr:ORF6N domain-containing protein [Bacteroidales bacterium]
MSDNINNDINSSQPVANCDWLPIPASIESCIFTFRDTQVMIDSDLAMLYG